MPEISDNVKGAILMCGSMAPFAINDTFMKLVGPDLGLSQSIFIRGVIASLLIGVFAWSRGAFRNLPSRRDSKLILVRSLSEIGSAFCFLTALFNMPLANITAILQSLPLAITVAAFFLVKSSDCGEALPLLWGLLV